jgi:hypothetical protein
MTASYTFDVFSSLDGYRAASANRIGYWRRQGPELLDRRLALYRTEQRMVFGANTYRVFAQMPASAPPTSTHSGCSAHRRISGPDPDDHLSHRADGLDIRRLAVITRRELTVDLWPCSATSASLEAVPVPTTLCQLTSRRELQLR